MPCAIYCLFSHALNKNAAMQLMASCCTVLSASSKNRPSTRCHTRPLFTSAEQGFAAEGVLMYRCSLWCLVSRCSLANKQLPAAIYSLVHKHRLQSSNSRYPHIHSDSRSTNVCSTKRDACASSRCETKAKVRVLVPYPAAGAKLKPRQSFCKCDALATVSWHSNDQSRVCKQRKRGWARNAPSP